MVLAQPEPRQLGIAVDDVSLFFTYRTAPVRSGLLEAATSVKSTIPTASFGAPVDGVRESWAPYDLETAEGIKVEVKSAAYLQAWAQEAPSKIQFVTPRRQGWDAQTGTVDLEAKRHADIYVLALLTHKDKPTLDPMDVEQWEFYVVPTRVLEEREQSQRSIRRVTPRKTSPPCWAFSRASGELTSSTKGTPWRRAAARPAKVLAA